VTTPGHFHRHDPVNRDRGVFRVKAITRVVAVGATATTGVLIALAFHETPNHVRILAHPAASVGGSTPATSPTASRATTPSTTPTTAPAATGTTGTPTTLSPPTTVPSAPVRAQNQPPTRVVTGQS